MPEYIFVYGTLRKETATSMHDVVARNCRFIAGGYMQGKLYEVDGYPGAVESESLKDKVYGEVWRVDDCAAVFPQLDDYEQCTDRYPEPHEYIRKRLTISLAGADSVTAWVYLFNHDVSNLVRIESGDYSSRRK